MKLADAVLVWLDVVPLNELTSEAAVSVVKMYREKQIELAHAITELWKHCEVEITDWVYFNFQIEKVEAFSLNSEKY